MLTPTGKYEENAGYGNSAYGNSGYGAGYGYYGQMSTAATEEKALPNIDFYGAVFRRKFVIILLAIFGAGIGYLLYSQAAPVYASSLRLMVWVQSPPTIVNGEVVSQTTVSISKQQNLIASELVLSNAVKNGGLDKLDTFKGSLNPIDSLKKMLRIKPVDLNSDALDLTLKGAIEKELPTILEEIVASYIKVIEEDTVEAGRESITLITRLQERLENDQKIDQSKYFDLLKKLNLTSENEAGKWVNPFTADIQRLKFEKEKTSKELDDLEQKLKSLRNSFDAKSDVAPIKRLMVIEAKKALANPGEREASLKDKMYAEEQSSIVRAQNRLDLFETKMFEIETQRDEALRQYGPKHPTSAAIETSYNSYKAKRDDLAAEVESMKQNLVTKLESVDKEEDMPAELKNKDRDMLILYGLKLSSEQSAADKQVKKLTQEIERLEESSKVISGDMAEVNMLKAQINERRDSVAKILEKLSAINVLANNYTTTKVRVIDPASGAKQVAPMLLIYLGLGVFGASLIGVGLAILIDQSDLSYRTPIDIQQSLSVPVICKIPKIKTKKPLPNQTASPILVTAFNSQSPAAETFRAARTALLFSAHQTNGKVFLFTSPSPGDGKSTTSSNLAISLAQAKKKVIIVDADFRRPRVQQNFGIQIEPGCVEVLRGELTLDEAIRPCEFQTNLSILTTGGRPKDAGELIASTEFANVVEQLRERYDIVIIDSPPILPVADSTSLSSIVDGIFLVLRIRRGVMLAAHKAKERLDMVQAKVLGVIVNGMDENVYYNEYGMYYRGGYYSGYGKYGKYYESQNSTYADKTEKEARKAKKASV